MIALKAVRRVDDRDDRLAADGAGAKELGWRIEANGFRRATFSDWNDVGSRLSADLA
jgi:hypothetical protein